MHFSEICDVWLTWYKELLGKANSMLFIII